MCLHTGPAAAQTFNERWSIIPNAHAEPAPETPRAEPTPATPEEKKPALQARPPIAGKSAHGSGGSLNRSIISTEFFPERPHTIRIRQERQRAVHRSIGICQLLRTAACRSAREFALLDLATNRSVVVVITDRGSRVRDRVLDLSLGAARSLGITDRGVAQERVEVL